ncbi:MAG: O-antigen ligase family protein, partial [Gammaproteobacteria bacterium]|nr:O-antigen ligase family protein [Gammaproteobacteria bacterium]NNL50493.1 hypothetical protein [Woeseiaceae bacterium]
LGAWAAGRLFSERRSPWWTAIVVAACLVMVLLSEARTAGLALVLGATIALLVTPALSDKPAGQVLVGLRTKRFYLVAGLTFIVLLTNASTISEDVSAYISKSRRAEVRTLAQAYELSRGAMIVEMWENFKARPFQGIGFGVSSDPEEMIVQRDPLSGLPISATVEKGVLPLAVLEELGVFGLLAVLLWLWMLMRRSARGGGITALLVLFVALLTNMGESVLFSPGGMGLLSLVLVGWAASQRSEVSVEVSNA